MMNSQVADDFYAALLATQQNDVMELAEAEREQATALLAQEVFGFLDVLTDAEHNEIDRLAA